MCCHGEDYPAYCSLFEKAGVDSIHFDVMDGHYVNNIMLGVSNFQDCCRLSRLPIDIHLMVERPENFVDYFPVRQGDKISFHPEVTHQPYRLLQYIRGKGCLAGLVLNPGTPVSFLEENLDQLDYVTLMTVNPGFAGQTMAPNALDKLPRVRGLLERSGREIDLFVDGNTTFKNASRMSRAGANGFVVGTSSLLKSPQEFNEKYSAYCSLLADQQAR